MSRIVRIRCPICGMLAWQSRLDKEWEFEVIIQHISSRGRGRIIQRYYEPETEEGVFLLKVALADKLEEVARKLRQEFRDEKNEAWWEAVKGGDWKKASGISSVYQADFDHIEASIHGMTVDKVEFLVSTGKGSSLFAEEKGETAGSGYGYEDDSDYSEVESNGQSSYYSVDTEEDEGDVEKKGGSSFRFISPSQSWGISKVKWGDDNDEKKVSRSRSKLE